MRLFRKILFWMHLCVGLTVGAGVAVLAGTGMLLAFERSILQSVEMGDGSPPAGQTQRNSLEQLLLRAAEIAPGATPTGATISADRNDPVAVALGRDRMIYLNAYTGEQVGAEAPRLRQFFRTVLSLHRWLAMNDAWRNVGRQTMGAVSIGFCALVLSGLWLWFPRTLRWTSIKAVLLPSLRHRGKTRDWNWHNAFGFWALLPLLAITLTGLIISYPWANRLYFLAAGQTPPPQREGGERRAERPRNEGTPRAARPLSVEGLDEMHALVLEECPTWTTITLQLGGRRGGSESDSAEMRDNPEQANRTEQNQSERGGQGGINFHVSNGDSANPLNRTTLSFNRRSGELTRSTRFVDQPIQQQLRPLVVPIHRGDILGTTGRIIAFTACLAALTLVYTGFALSWRRLVRPVLKRIRDRRMISPPNPETEMDSAPCATST